MKVQKKLFFLSGLASTPPPPLSGRVTKKKDFIVLRLSFPLVKILYTLLDKKVLLRFSILQNKQRVFSPKMMRSIYAALLHPAQFAFLKYDV